MSAPTDAQISSYSSLAGALTPTVRPYYELPQDTNPPDAPAQNSSPSTMKPILFELASGRPWVPLSTALGNFFDLQYNMVGGWDLAFPQTAGNIKVDLRVMVCLHPHPTLFSC